jgi:hypothetical protein
MGSGRVELKGGLAIPDLGYGDTLEDEGRVASLQAPHLVPRG